MPTNLPPDYYEIEKRFRAAESAAEKANLLEEMYSVVPKHKGTDHLRADLRRQISRLKTEVQQARKKHGGHASAFQIEREGAGQVVLTGAPNAGKSALLSVLTHADPEVSEVPFTTWRAAPGMMPFENIQIQLVDTPPLDRTFVEPGLFDLCRRADLLLVVVDILSDPLDQLETSLSLLEEHFLAPGVWEGRQDLVPRTMFKPLIVVVNKVDSPDQDEDFTAFCELIDPALEALPVSALHGRFFDLLGQRIYKKLGIIRVYARPPGKEPDLERPFVLMVGQTVEDLALKIHKDFFENMKSARVWGSSTFEGQMVQRDFVLQDGDIVELKTT